MLYTYFVVCQAYTRALKFDTKPDVPFLRKLFRELYTSLGCANTGKHWDWDHIDTDHMNDGQSSSGAGGVGAVGIAPTGGGKLANDGIIVIDDLPPKQGNNTNLGQHGTSTGIPSSSAAAGAGGVTMTNIQQVNQYNTMHSLDMMRPSTAAAVAPMGRDREVINLADDEDEESDRNVALMNNDILDEEVLHLNNNGTYNHCNLYDT